MTKKYIKLVHNNPDHENWFVVNWCIGNTCNYSCSYCPSGLHDGSKAWPDPNTVKQFIARLAEQTFPKNLYFEFTGGEVTLWKYFTDICQFCKDLNIKIGLISNGSRTIRYWEENKHYFDHICLSYHPEEANSEHFVNVVKTVHKELRTHVNIMMSPEKFDECYILATKIKELGDLSIALQPLIHDFGDTLYEYTPAQHTIFDKQHELIVKHIKYTKDFPYYRGAMRKVFEDGTSEPMSAQRFINDKTNNWRDWDCYAGVEQIVVDMDGRIFRGWCKEGGSIGQINDPKLMIPQDPIICSKTMCHCNFDIMATKELVE
jgi:MoaA/NifB/PqqE/SkfB family radical SAM enzyme